jgi:hypothetical protein
MTAYSPITKYEDYNDRMARSVLDKLFFLDKIDADILVDFGCADGTLFRYLKPYAAGIKLIGFDSDAEMCRIARETAGSAGDAEFIEQWDNVLAQLRTAREQGKQTALLLSSVIHEIYNYCDPREIDETWKRIWDAAFDFVIIRDMIPSESVDRESDPNDVQKVLRKFRTTPELKDFERRWGSIQNNKNLVHFLLKYRYVQPNWPREVKENYLPLYWEDLMASIPEGYDVLYQEHYPLPFIKRQVRKDLGIELKDATHLKLILERRA